MLLNFLLFLLAFVGLLLPAFLMPISWIGEGKDAEGFLNRVLAALGLAIFLSFTLSEFHQLMFFWKIWGLGITILVLLRSRMGFSRTISSFVPPAQLLILLSLVVLLYFSQAFMHEIPPGWDPSFHMILAKKALLSNGTFDSWMPFEDVRRNYPLGSHFLIVLLSWMREEKLLSTFNFLIPALGVLATLQVFALGRVIFKSELAGLYSALAYGLWAIYGSIGYYDWGGLPNQLGMLFLLQILLLLQKKESRSSLFWGGIFFASLCFVHHHVMLCAFVIFLALLSPWPRRASLPVGERKHLFLILICGGLLSSFYLLPYAMRALTLGNTSVWTFKEPYFSLPYIFSCLGYVFSFGLFLFLLARYMLKEKVGAHPILWRSLFSLLFLFALFGYLYRFYALWRYGESLVAFTPSRFLTNSVYFMSLLVGWALFKFNEKSRLRAGSFFIGLVLLSSLNFFAWKEIAENQFDQDLFKSFLWIRDNSEENTILLNQESWASYASWRITMKTPIPISEPAPWKSKRRKRLSKLKEGKIPPEFEDYSIYAVRPSTDLPKETDVLFTKGVWSTLRIYP